jgi:HNH endonuclease
LPITKTYTRGYWAHLGSLGRSRRLELWLDRYLDRPEPFFWFGFWARRPEPIQELVDASPERLKPLLSLNPDDAKEVDGSSVLKRRLSDDDLQKVIRESYPQDYIYCLGKYARTYPPLKNGSLLDVSRAATFLEEVTKALAFATPFVEGPSRQVTTDKFEINPKARAACVAHFGCRCVVCKMTFEEVYGREHGSGFIHVHHKQRRADRAPSQETDIDPKQDLVPVCPNCHAMLHKSTPPILPEDLACILSEQKAAQ